MNDWFRDTLLRDIDCVLPEIRARVEVRGGMTIDDIFNVIAYDANNCPIVRAFGDRTDVYAYDSVSCDDEQVGELAIAKGEVAFVVLAGGTSASPLTVIPGLNVSLVAWKVMQGGDMPVWIMTSLAQLDAVGNHVRSLATSPGTKGCVFTQFEGYTLTIHDKLSWSCPGIPRTHTLGHGDLGPALLESGLLAENPQVKYLYVCNVNNVMASPHEGLLGKHIKQGMQVTREVVDRQSNDVGGVLAWLDRKCGLQVVEDWCLPRSNVASFHNTNSMILNVDIIKSKLDWRWHRMINGNEVEHRRLLNQYSEEFLTMYVQVPRDSRYIPIKDEMSLNEASKRLMSYEFKR